MTLQDAIDAFELGRTRDDTLPVGAVLEVSSQGTVGKDHVIPALYAHEADAITEWFRTINRIANHHDGAPYRWMERPKLESYQVTMQDGRGTHRLVSDRYVVTCKITFGA